MQPELDEVHAGEGKAHVWWSSQPGGQMYAHGEVRWRWWEGARLVEQPVACGEAALLVALPEAHELQLELARDLSSVVHVELIRMQSG